MPHSKKRAEPIVIGPAPDFTGNCRTESGLAPDLDDVFGRGAFGALDDVELDALALGERAEALTRDGRAMNEAIIMFALCGDEPKALGVIEPLHRASRACHASTPNVLLC